MSIKNKLQLLFEDKKELSVDEIVSELIVSKQYVHRILNQFVESNKIERIGLPPKTIYKLKIVSEKKEVSIENISSQKQQFLQDNFIVITEIGQLLYGFEAFQNWCDCTLIVA